MKSRIRSLCKNAPLFTLVILAVLLLGASPAAAAIVCTSDVDGPNDEPGQKDLTQFCLEIPPTPPNNLVTQWSWDEVRWNGNNTGDACTLYDTDGDFLANLAVCVTVGGNPAVQQSSSPRLYNCGDTRQDRCTNAALVVGPYLTTCTVSQVPNTAFPANDEGPLDTQAHCNVRLVDFGPTTPANAVLLDACSYPSQQPNSDPSDCVAFRECNTNADCSDGNACNGAEICTPGGSCQPGQALNCNDNNACTADSCVPATGCVNTDTSATCNDGLFCNGTETCNPVSGCQAGTAPNCNDGVSCTTDTCNESTDSCNNAPVDSVCNNGDVCDGAETCDAINGCQPGTPLVCGNGNVCDGTETCDPTNGCQPGTPLVCDNNLFCDGTETCDVTDGCQSGTPPTCTGNACNDGVCNEDTDSCGVQPANEGDACGSGSDTDCDNPDTCSAGSCVPNYETTSTVCRESIGVCDVPESCDGAGSCPADGFATSSMVCNAGDPAVCDPAETCSGGSASCPADDPGDGCPDASCRTAGYWGTHAGIEKERQGSLNVTLMSIALAGGSIDVCGQTLDDTDVESASSAVEGLCEGGGGITQLARQLIAMALNCVNSESPADCSGVPEWTSTFSTCDAACADGTNSDLIGECINVVDCFNNGGQPSLGSEGEFLCSTGNCSDNGADCNSGNKGLCEDSALATCTPYEFTCHMNPLLYPDSPAGSSKACNKANKSDCTIFDAGLCDNP